MRFSTGLGYFSLTFPFYDFWTRSRMFRVLLPWIVSMASLAPSFCNAAVASPFADMGGGNAPDENGEIAGGFFSNVPLTQAAMPLAVAMPQSLKPTRVRPGCCHRRGGKRPTEPANGDLKPWPRTIDAHGAGSTYAAEQAAEGSFRVCGNLTAGKAGLPVLTSNRDEFDLIQQLVPSGRFIHLCHDDTKIRH